MSPRKAQLQSQVLALRAIPGVELLYRQWYRLATVIFRRFTARASAECGGAVRAIYLRRGGGRGDVLPGASDLDYFLVLETLPAEGEMAFLKAFWRRYHFWRRPFPFLGEVLMGDENELRHWLAAPTVRSFEACFSWQLIAGPEARAGVPPPERPDLRDSFSEALKHYADLLQPVIKLQDDQFHAELLPHSPAAVKLRHAAKAAIDIFRLHAGLDATPGELARYWRMPRTALALELDPESRLEGSEGLEGLEGSELARTAHGYPGAAALVPLLNLQGPLFPGTDPFSLFSELLHRAAACLHEMALRLAANSAEPATADWRISYASRSPATDPYSLSVRELFAERMLLRHESTLKRAVLAEDTAHMYFSLTEVPDLETFRALLLDLRDVNFSFDRFSVAMPITEATFRELARTSLLDSPFHSFSGHQEIAAGENGAIESRPYRETGTRLPTAMLQKTFAELSFGLRFQPRELGHFFDKMVALVLGLRLAAEHREITTDFSHTLQRYGERYPGRVAHLNALIAPYRPTPAGENEIMWGRIFALLDDYSAHTPGLRQQLEILRRQNRERPDSATAATDAWINLTPFLRMEMNAMKDRYFPERPSLKI